MLESWLTTLPLPTLGLAVAGGVGQQHFGNTGLVLSVALAALVGGVVLMRVKPRKPWRAEADSARCF
jgi:hypothetical protein